MVQLQFVAGARAHARGYRDLIVIDRCVTRLSLFKRRVAGIRAEKSIVPDRRNAKECYPRVTQRCTMMYTRFLNFLLFSYARARAIYRR